LKVNASAPDAGAASDQVETAGMTNAEVPSSEAPPVQMAASSEIEPQLWTEADEATYQALAVRRKAAGYRRRGRGVGSQLIAAGDIKPNPNTTVATIVELVAAKGILSRSELVDAMGSATFLHRKAHPQDQGWCQGYIAGAIRGGFLKIAECSSTPAA
jgi:hypothetical protein